MIYDNIKKLLKKELDAIEEKMIAKICVNDILQNSLTNFLKSPSKRIRSAISILYYKAQFQDELNDEQLEFLSCVELIHNASLIHDDIIDESEKRRGKQSLYKEFTTQIGILSGDYILSVAFEKLCDLGMARLFATTLKQMCKGEINQNFNRYKIGTIEEYIEKSKAKTGYLFQTAIYGTMLLSNEKFDKEKCKEFGINLGIAFQIKDDLENLIGKDKTKPQKSDIKEGIYTAPIIYSQDVENYSEGIEKTIYLLNNYIEKTESAIEYFGQNEYTKTIKEYLQQQCGKN